MRASLGAISRLPYLTPQDLPEDDDCRPLSIPASSEWLALFGGALTEFIYPYNWEYSGGLTIDETIAKMREIIDNWYESPCQACTTPGGYRTIRINDDGKLEQLNSDGDWEPATDEYYIPPPESRTGGTEEDQICLAAKNAVNVLEQLYENLSDSYNDALDEAEALTAYIEGAIAIIGFEFAPITWAIAAFMLPVFALLYGALEFVFADLWTADVSAQITCFLKLCMTNDAGVVTVDWNCFNRQLNSFADDFSLTAEQQRLYIQIGYMLYFIGGADGLNLAARTTDITDDDCTECNCSGTSIDFSVSDFGFTQEAWGGYAAAGTYGNLGFGQGIYADASGGVNQIGVSGTVDEVCGSGVNIDFNRVFTPPSATMQIRVVTSTQTKNATFTPVGTSVNVSVPWDEGGTLLPDTGTVYIGYVGTTGYGIVFVGFQTGDI